MAEIPPETPSPAPPDAPPASGRGFKVYRWSVRQYVRGLDLGILLNVRLELLGGIMIRQLGRTSHHVYPMLALEAALRALVPAPWLVASGQPLHLAPRSRPEPDLMVVRGPVTLYKERGPRTRDLALVVEVADASYLLDRGYKWRRYAAARVPAYWIVHLNERRIEVYREPAGTGAGATFAVAEMYGIDAAIPVLIKGVEVGRIAVRDVLA